MMLQKKWKRFGVILLMAAVLLTGCGENQKKEVVVHAVDAENYNAPGTRWNGPLMKGENGFYEKSGFATEFCFQYIDAASGKHIYVCNRPECQHQGDEFCTATSNRYEVSGYTMYDGEIYIAAYDEQKADGKRLVLLRLEPDGSALSEVTVLKEEAAADSGIRQAYMFIHRGVCFVNYAFVSQEGTQFVYGTSIYNLLDGTTTQLPEYEYAFKTDGTSQDIGEVRTNFMGNENYVYYNEPKQNPSRRNSKIVLCRYNLEDGSIEDMENVIKYYKGVYTVTEPGKTVLCDKYGNLYRYDWDSQELIKNDPIKYQHTGTYINEMGEKVQFVSYVQELIPTAFCYYDKTLFAVMGPGFCGNDYLYLMIGSYNYFGVYTLDEEMNPKQLWDTHFFDNIIQDHLGDKFSEYLEYADGDVAASGWSLALKGKLSITQDTLYMQSEKGLYAWPMSDFLAQKGEFTRVYATEETE